MSKRALIFGVSGQDGAYLSKFLLSKGYEVYGASRDAQNSSFTNLKKVKVFSQLKLVSSTLNNFRSVLQTIINTQPDEVYNLAGQSSVAFSFEEPVETIESIAIGTLNILEAIRFTGKTIKFYNAGSSECFGNTDTAVNELTPFRPRSPYGVAKATAFWSVCNYREAYNIYSCTGILFNHESPLRKNRFVTKKIISTAVKISEDANIKLNLGNINIHRDWGWAPDYVEAMWLMMQQDKADDFIIATGVTTSLEQFIDLTFSYLGLNWKDHVVLDEKLIRPIDINIGLADPSKAKRILGWSSKVNIKEIVKLMIQDQKELNED